MRPDLPAGADWPTPSMALVAWATIIAPVVALGTRFALPAPGVILFLVILSAPLWIAGYALLVTAVATGMLRRRGALRASRHRIRAAAWGWLTSAGAILLGLTLVDFDEQGRGAHSGLTLVLGSPPSPSTVHDVSLIISWFAVAAWLIGYGGLLREWIVATKRFRAERPAARPVETPALPSRR